MASFVQSFIAENVAELRRMNARQFIQQIVALGAHPERAETQLRQPLRARRAAPCCTAVQSCAGGAIRGVQGRHTCNALRPPSRRALTRGSRRADRHLRAGDLEVVDGGHRQRVAGASLAQWRGRDAPFRALTRAASRAPGGQVVVVLSGSMEPAFYRGAPASSARPRRRAAFRETAPPALAPHSLLSNPPLSAAAPHHRRHLVSVHGQSAHCGWGDRGVQHRGAVRVTAVC